MRSAPLATLSLAAGLLALAACASSSSSSAGAGPSPGIDMSLTAPSPDPRVGLKGGWFDAHEALWNVSVVSHTRPSAAFLNLSTPGDARLKNSDLAFSGNYVIQGNYSGYQVWDISNARNPTLKTAFVCPGSQSDVTVYKNLMFVSAEAVTGRLDCGMTGVEDTVSKERARGIRIFDVTDITHPKSIKTVQTCRGSHTNTLVDDPNDPSTVYVYVSGSSSVRPNAELAGCSGGTVEENPNSAQFRIEVIRVPVAHPEDAAIVTSPRIFEGLTSVTRHAEYTADEQAAAARAAGRAGRGGAAAGRGGRGPAPAGVVGCHDITAYPAIGFAGGACGGHGILLDIRDPAHPKRVSFVVDTNFSGWHSVTFSNNGDKILFSDEWGGGTQPRCRATDNLKWGADAIYTLVGGKMTPHGYFKMPAAQTVLENCVSHNGSLIPIPGRDIMVQAYYQGGLTIFEFTDPDHPREVGFYDRGPMDDTKFVDAGFWSTYWYNGYIIGSEIARGMDIFELKPSGLISQNEIDAAKLIHMDYFNPQDQPKLVWPAHFSVSRSYLDQLVRDHGISTDRSSAIKVGIDRAQGMSGSGRRDALNQLAREVEADARTAKDAGKVRLLAASLVSLADATK